MLQLQALNRFLGRVKYKQMSNFIAIRSPEPTAYENLAKARSACASLATEKKKERERKQKKPEINTRNSGDERPTDPGERKCILGRLWACQCIDGNRKLRYFHLALFLLF